MADPLHFTSILFINHTDACWGYLVQAFPGNHGVFVLFPVLSVHNVLCYFHIHLFLESANCSHIGVLNLLCGMVYMAISRE